MVEDSLSPTCTFSPTHHARNPAARSPTKSQSTSPRALTASPDLIAKKKQAFARSFVAKHFSDHIAVLEP